MKELDLEKYINEFTEFYGEEYRFQITKKIYNVEFVFLDDVLQENDVLQKNATITREDILNNPDVLKILSSVTAQKQSNEEILEKVKQKIESLNIKGDKTPYIDSMFKLAIGQKDGAAAYTTAFIKDDEEAKPLTLCVFQKNKDIETHDFYHELTHVVHSSFNNITNESFCWQTGFLGLTIKLDGKDEETDDETKLENNKLFNEVITDYLTMQMCNTPREQLTTSYSTAFMYLCEFFETYKPEIMHCLMSDNPMQFQNIIGKENFENLTKYTADMLTNYPDSCLYSIINSISATLGKPINNFTAFKNHFAEIAKLPLGERERGYVDCYKSLTTTTNNIINQKTQKNNFENDFEKQ